MGKRRNTAKTGDKAIYKSRGKDQVAVNKDDDDDPMYGKVDRFHKAQEEFLKLDDNSDKNSEDEEEVKEAVMNLGVGGDDESSSDDNSEDDSQDEEDASREDDNAKVSSDSEEDDDEIDDVRDWGKKKTAYYHGDTADLEIGQDEEDAYLEEEAAKEVQAARYKEMSEDDFVLSDTEKDEGDAAIEKVSSMREVSKLSTKDRQKLLDKQHPEMRPLLAHFSGAVREYVEKTNVATKAIFEGEEGSAEAVGTTRQGKRYLLTKALLQSSTALNLVMYLLLKSDQPSDVDPSLIQSHPVIASLQKLNALTHHMEGRVDKRVPGLADQLTNLVEAAALMKSGTVDLQEEGCSELKTGDDEDNSVSKGADGIDAEKGTSESSSEEDNSDDESSTENMAAEERRVLTEARFGLRQTEVSDKVRPKTSQRKITMDFGDGRTNDVANKAARSLASTLNTIEQKTNSRKRRSAPLPDIIDDAQNEDDELRRGIAMMEEEMGKDFDKEDDRNVNDGKDDDNEKYDAELEDDDDPDGGFYSKVASKSKVHKANKKAKYAVAPKFPRVEHEVEGERAIGRMILKNRGLVAHKSKLNRNPRVKKREQYRKALIRRKGAVRDVRTDEGHKYGGEETGIKTSISRSRKLAR